MQNSNRQQISVVLILGYVFAALAFVMLFFSPFGPLDSSVIPVHPIGWAGIFVFLAMVCIYSQKYQRTKESFWFILVLMFFPVLISDLYFFPIPEIMGFGMGEWMGAQLLVCFVCFSVVANVKAIRYFNWSMLLLFPLVVVMYLYPQSELSAPLLSLSIISLFVIAVTLSYYAYVRKEYLLIFGVILNFIVSMPIPNMYIIAGFIPFGWDQPLMAVITDRIAIFGRILMVISWPVLVTLLTKSRNLDQL